MDKYQDDSRLQEYVSELLHWNQRINLIGRQTESEVWTNHIRDSLALLPFLEQDPVNNIVDIGSGGGLPGIPLSLFLPGRRFILTETNSRKLAFLQWIISKLKLSAEAVEITPERVFDFPCLIISRAFSSVAHILQWQKQHAPGATCFYLLKGMENNARGELTEAGVTGEIIRLEKGTVVKIKI